MFIYLITTCYWYSHSFILFIIPVGREFTLGFILQFKLQVLLKSHEMVVRLNKLNLATKYFLTLKRVILSFINFLIQFGFQNLYI